jgi:hypothetical protein
MSLENQDSVRSDSADREIPDRRTAEAAEWLSQQNAGFDTPTFWLVAGLLANFKAAPPSSSSGERAENCDWPFSGVCQGDDEACLKANRCLKNLPAAPSPTPSVSTPELSDALLYLKARKALRDANSAPSVSTEPRCPKCGNDGKGLGCALVVGVNCVKCWACATRFEIKHLADFSQFFRARSSGDGGPEGGAAKENK